LSHLRSPLPDGKKNKFELILMLRGDGWAPADAGVVLAAYRPGRAKVYRESLEVQQSYLTCLVTASELFEKSIPEILHGKTDGYYKALLKLTGSQLQAMLALGDDAGDSRYKALLDGAPGSNEEGSAEEDEPGEDPGPLEDAIAVEAGGSGGGDRELPGQWTRARASFQEHPVGLGVYFDHPSAARRQKGYVTCRTHPQCTRWRMVFGSKKHYCAYMLAWERADHDFSAANPHMKYEPSTEEVADVERALVLEDF
jgi:hypothetical protein